LVSLLVVGALYSVQTTTVSLILANDVMGTTVIVVTAELREVFQLSIGRQEVADDGALASTIGATDIDVSRITPFPVWVHVAPFIVWGIILPIEKNK
jgi:hypothetical protein